MGKNLKYPVEHFLVFKNSLSKKFIDIFSNTNLDNDTFNNIISKMNYVIDKKIKYKLNLEVIKSILISGDSGSGKSTLTKQLKNLFKNSIDLECDRYHKWERYNDNWNNYILNPNANPFM